MNMVEQTVAADKQHVRKALMSLDINTYKKFKRKPKDYIEKAPDLDWVSKAMIKAYWGFDQTHLRKQLEARVGKKRKMGKIT